MGTFANQPATLSMGGPLKSQMFVLISETFFFICLLKEII